MTPITSKVLTDDEVYRIHLTSLEILDNLGIRVQEKEALKIFEKAGARVDWDIERAYLPPHLCQEIIRTFSPYLSLYDTNGARVMNLGGDQLYFGSNGFAPFVVDWRTGETREVVDNDLAEITKLNDALEFPDFVQVQGQPSEYPAGDSDLHQARRVLLLTRKPVHTHAYNTDHALKIFKMAAEVMGGEEKLRRKPHLVMNINTFSPLTMRQDAAEVVREAAKAGIPVLVTAGCMGGATSPVTLAGELAQANAEILAHIIYAKIVNPSATAIYASWCRIFDMKFSTCTVATPEFALMRMAIAQLAKFYNLPSAGGALLADSNTLDAQFGWEKLMTALLPAMSGLNIIVGMGMLSQLNAMSCEALVMDCEMACIIKRIRDGIIVDSDHLAYNVIAREYKRADFLSSSHTLTNFKKEHFIPSVTDRSMLEQWKESGAKDARIRTQGIIENLLDKYKKPTLPANIESKLEEIMQR